MFAHARELAQKGGEVLPAARDRAQVHGEVRPFYAPKLDIGVKLHAHLKRRVLPLVARAIEVDGVGEAVRLHAAGLLGRLLLGDVVERQAAVGLVIGLCLARLVGHGHVCAVLARLAGGGGGGIGGVFLLLARLGLTACGFLGRHAVPGLVVVGKERRGQLRELLVVHPLVGEVAVQGLGGELRAFRLKLGEGGGLARGARACRCRERQLGDDRLDGYIACSIPTRSVHARVGEGVQKHVVQHDVQVCARKLFRA